MTFKTKASALFISHGLTIHDAMVKCDAFYNCPLGPKGEILGNVVGYAGTYETVPGSGNKLNWVGLRYWNFAKVERLHHILEWFARDLAGKAEATIKEANFVLAAPMGGILLGQRVASELDLPYGYAEKKTIDEGGEGKRGKSILIANRHEIPANAMVLLQEDIFNNGSTTEEVIALAGSVNSKIVGILCAVNRSNRNEFVHGDTAIPIVSLAHIPTDQYRQDDLTVAGAIANGQLTLKPKDHWPTLKEMMLRHAA